MSRIEMPKQTPEVVDRSPLEHEVALLLGVSLEQVPRIHLHYAFVRHHRECDTEWLKPHIDLADVVLIERSGYSKHMQLAYMALSQGHEDIRSELERFHRTTKRGGQGGYDIGIEKLIFNTQKTVMAHDVSENMPLAKQMTDTSDEMYSFEKSLKFRRLPFDTALEMHSRLHETFAAQQIQRETHVLSFLPRAIAHALTHDTKLTGKEEVTILTLFGAAHTPMYAQVKKLHTNTTRSFPTLPYHYPVASQFPRKIGFGVPITHRDRMVHFIASLAENCMYSYLIKRHKNLHPYTAGSGFVHSLSEDEIRSLYSYIEYGDTKGFAKAVEAKLKVYLSAKRKLP